MVGHLEAILPDAHKVSVQLHWEKENSINREAEEKSTVYINIWWLLLKEDLETMLLNKQLWKQNLNVKAGKGKTKVVVGWQQDDCESNKNVS